MPRPRLCRKSGTSTHLQEVSTLEIREPERTILGSEVGKVGKESLCCLTTLAVL